MGLIQPTVPLPFFFLASLTRAMTEAKVGALFEEKGVEKETREMPEVRERRESARKSDVDRSDQILTMQKYHRQED